MSAADGVSTSSKKEVDGASLDTTAVKRKLSTGQSEANKKPKTEAIVAIPEESRAQFDDGDELIPLSSSQPNVVYGWADAVMSFFDGGNSEEGVYWLKYMILDAHQKLTATNGQKNADEYEEELREIGIPYLAITCTEDDLQTEEAKVLLDTFYARLHVAPSEEGWWWELKLVRTKPKTNDTGNLSVTLSSSEFCSYAGNFELLGGADLGKWWLIDIVPAEEDSLKSIKKVHKRISGYVMSESEPEAD